MDRPSAWHTRSQLAEDNGQEIQPLLCMKDSWSLCNCEIPGPGSQVLPPYGQLNSWGEPLQEYVLCPLDLPIMRNDWRVGRELSDEWSAIWVMESNRGEAHHLEEWIASRAGKRNASDITVPAPDGIDLSSFIGDAGITAGERDRLERIVRDLPSESITVTFTPADFSEGRCYGRLTADSGGNYVFMDVSEELMEDQFASNYAVRRVLDEFERRFGSGREGGGADSGGPPSAGTDGGGGASALQT